MKRVGRLLLVDLIERMFDARMVREEEVTVEAASGLGREDDGGDQISFPVQWRQGQEGKTHP